ncbi:MAG: hypothetical protein HYY13_09805 [Nitrospirae bacterium]|nr:hypothetical protein [Nitrospirota bacterium]
MSILAIGLAATAGAMVNVQQSIHRAFHLSEGNHIMEELLNQVRMGYIAAQSGVGLYGEAGVPIVDNFFSQTGTKTLNPRVDNTGQNCTNVNPSTQNCLFKFYNRNTGNVENIKNGSDSFPCPSSPQLTTTCFDPDPADDDPTVYRIEWTITDIRDDMAGIGSVQKGAGIECAGLLTDVLMKNVSIKLRWMERGQEVSITRSIRVGC